MRVHPKFKHDIGPIVSIWPRSGELYVCDFEHLNFLNEAKNVILMEERDYTDVIESYAVCCYGLNQLKRFITLGYKEYPFLYSPMQKYTYTIIGDDGSRKWFLHSYFYNWKYLPYPKAKKIGYCDFVLSQQTLELHKMNYNIDCVIKNQIQAEVLIHLDKNNLYSLFPEFMMETYDFQNALPVIHKEGDVWIIKAYGKLGYGGKGMSVVTKESDIPGAVKELNGLPAIIQRYITNPLLFKGRKFHLRVLVMVSNFMSAKIGPYIFIYTAKKEYQQGDWHNKDIHDSHLKTTDDVYLFDEQDFDHKFYRKKLYTLVRRLEKSIHHKPYNEVKYGYQILGLDVMITKDSLYLLEVNRTPTRALANYKKEYPDVSWEFQHVRSIFAFRDFYTY